SGAGARYASFASGRYLRESIALNRLAFLPPPSAEASGSFGPAREAASFPSVRKECLKGT
ncbi:MAG: hypothetical protein AAGB04_28835, partial [Pseudomonadota bacterium]